MILGDGVGVDTASDTAALGSSRIVTFLSAWSVDEDTDDGRVTVIPDLVEGVVSVSCEGASALI